MRSTLALLLVACGTTTQLPGRPPPATDAADTDTDADTDADSDTDADTDTDVDTDPPSTASVVRFVALGDAGEGNTDQFAVADAMEQVCALRGCDFALYLGDNFYDTGVDGVDDPQFQTKFEDPYANLTFPFYVTMGNHDLGLDGMGVEFWLSTYYVRYTDHSDKWTMPATHYDFRKEKTLFFALDTTEIFFGFGAGQQRWLDDRLDLAPAWIDWKIGFGHHPYISNGQHGNAGRYEGILPAVPLSEIPRGQYVKEFVQQSVCGELDVYISGHDHNRQWLDPRCGTQFVVSGAGAKTTDLEGRGNPTAFEDDVSEGFLWVEIDGRTLHAAFFDKTGALDFETTMTK